MKFKSGQVVMTRGVEALRGKVALDELLARHLRGDDGDMCAEDHKENQEAIKTGEARVHSSYETPHGKIWIITEWDRSVTTLLLPDEY